MGATGADVWSLAKDGNGNITKLTGSPDSSVVYNYDNKLKYANKGSDSISVKYDPMGNRIVKNSNWNGIAKNQRFIVDINSDLPVILCSLDENGSLEKKYYHVGAQIIAQETPGTNAELFYYVHDRLGSVRAVIDTDMLTINEYNYDAFGKMYTEECYEATDTETGEFIAENPFKYTGQYFDTEIGQYHLRARMYDPTMRRFTGRDPVDGYYEDPMSLHRYLYCINDPVNRNDISGELPCGLGDTFGAMVAYSAGLSFAVAGTEADMLGNYGTGDMLWAISDWLMTDVMFEFASSGAMKALAGICFTADTEILTESGLTPIADIQAGDMVWAFDFDSGEKVLKQVVRTFQNHTEEIYTVTVAGEEIETTSGHPFYVNGKGWTKASELHVGDSLETFSGKSAIVENVVVVCESTAVYNFEVADLHNYYVSENCVLVHNTCKNPQDVLSKVAKKKYVKNPHDIEGSYGIYDETGTFVEKVRIDYGTPGKPGWGGKTMFTLMVKRDHIYLFRLI